MAELSDFSLTNLPTDEIEQTSVAPDGAPADGLGASPGLPWESSRRPDVEAGLSDRDRVVPLEQLTPEATAVQHDSDGGLDLIKSFEGFSPTRYLDPVGVPTIGYGTTAAVVSPLPARCTRDQATGWLRLYVQRFVEPALRATGAKLNEHQFAAFCSLGYNLGAGCFSSGWTVGRDLRAHNIAGAINAILLYDVAGGVVLAGLKRRRQAEHALALTPMPPPPDPHHLHTLLNAVVKVGGKRLNERGVADEFYRLLAHKDRSERQLHALQSELVLLRKRAWSVAHFEQPPKWGSDRLGARWQVLDRATSIKL